MSESMVGTGRRLDVHPGRKREVTTLELFSDLVYILTLTQLLEHLLKDLDWRGVLETFVLLLAVFCVWSSAAYNSTTILIRSRAIYPIVVAAMFVNLVMNTAIGGVFGGSPWMFVAPMLVVQFDRTFVVRRMDVYEALRKQRTAVAVWLRFSSLLWVAGCFASREQRFWLWLAAAPIDLAGRWTQHPLPKFDWSELSRMPFDLGHQIRRCRLFFIVCLASGFLAVGNATKRHLDAPLSIAVGLLSLAAIACLWYIYFWRTAVIGGLISGESGRSTNGIGLGLLVAEEQQMLAAGIVAFTAGMEVAVGQSRERISASTGLLLGRGPALCLIALWFVFVKGKVHPEGLNFARLTIFGVGVLLALLRPAGAIAVIEVAIVTACACLMYGNGVGKMRPSEQADPKDSQDPEDSLCLGGWTDPKAVRSDDREQKPNSGEGNLGDRDDELEGRVLKLAHGGSKLTDRASKLADEGRELADRDDRMDSRGLKKSDRMLDDRMPDGHGLRFGGSTSDKRTVRPTTRVQGREPGDPERGHHSTG